MCSDGAGEIAKNQKITIKSVCINVYVAHMVCHTVGVWVMEVVEGEGVLGELGEEVEEVEEGRELRQGGQEGQQC